MTDEQRARDWIEMLATTPASGTPAETLEVVVASLTALLASIRAEERARVIEECCAAAEALREGPNTPTIGGLVATIRSLPSDPALVVVRREDLAC